MHIKQLLKWEYNCDSQSDMYDSYVIERKESMMIIQSDLWLTGLQHCLAFETHIMLTNVLHSMPSLLTIEMLIH